MNRPSNERYQGRFTAPERKSARRITGGTLALLILFLSLARLGVETLKLLTYADVFIGGGRMLIYGDVHNVDMGDSVNGVPIVDEVPTGTDDYILRLNDGTTIVYQGHTYELNRDLTTVLFLGIDHEIQETDVIGTGGQSDVILLIAIDTNTGETTILNIDRNSYAQVEIYSADNKYIGTRFEQITVAYGYGNGRETSCENTVRSVSRLLFGLPISSYLAMDMNGIQSANEAVGHVTLNSLIDVTMKDGVTFKKGDPIELQGAYLDRYIRTRGHDLEANTKRMERQKQYVSEFAKLAVAKSREDLTFPVDLFSSLAPYMVTNLDIPDVTFLSSTFLNHGATFSFRGISGTYGKLGGSTVCYLDETDLFEAVLQIFYTMVD